MATEGRQKEGYRVRIVAGSLAAASPDRRSKSGIVVRAFHDQCWLPRVDVLFDGETEPVHGYDDALFEGAPARPTFMRLLRLTRAEAQPERAWVDGTPEQLATHAKEMLTGFWDLSSGQPKPKPLEHGMTPELVEIVTEIGVLLARYSVYELHDIKYDWSTHDGLRTGR